MKASLECSRIESKSATEGLWVYLPDGLAPGNYTIEFGGSYFGGFLVLDITYNLKVK